MLPTKWVDDVAFVAVAINGKPAGRFMLDTGADAVVLTRATIDSLELPRVVIGDDKNKIVVAGAGNTQVASTGGAAVAELRCGPLVLRNLDALEADTTTFSRALGCPVAGVLPVTAFRDVVLTIDYVARRVEVAEPPGETPRGSNTLPLGPASVPIVPMRIGSAEVSLLIDSGSDEYLTLPDNMARSRRGQAVETGKARAIGGDVSTRHARLNARLDLAGHVLEDPVVEVVQDSAGAIGTELLRHFRVVIDQPHGCVTFSRASDQPLRSPPVRRTGLGLLRDGSHWTVAYLLAGTPAVTTKVRVGDEVVAVDGVAVGDLSRRQYARLVDERDVLRFRVRAGNNLREVDVPVAVLVP